MRKFIFTMQALLHLKQALDKQERNNLGTLSRRLNQLLSDRDDMARRRETASEEYGARLASGMRALETQQYTGYFRMMKELIGEQDKKIHEAQDEIEACRRKLVEIMREIHMLETLRDKQYQEYLQEVQIEEEKTIGDFVSYQSKQKPAG